MESAEQGSILTRAEELLSDLYGDLQTAPLELLTFIDSFAPRLEETIERYREKKITDRELEAHVHQIRLSYLRDLTRLLATEV